MKTLLTTLTCALIISVVQAQDCAMDKYQVGNTVTFDIFTYSNPHLYTPLFTNPNPKKKDLVKREEIKAQYLKDIEDGIVKPSKSNFSYKVTLFEEDESSQLIQLEAEVNGATYTSQGLCQNDSMYLTRNLGPIVSEHEGKVIGASIQGVQVIPLKIEVGMILPIYQDITLTVPETKEYTVQHKVFSHMKKTRSIERNAFHLDVTDNKFKTGTWEVTKSQAVYDEIDVEVKKTTQFSMHNIHYAKSLVTGKTSINVLGTDYEAYIIESESWMKTDMEVEFETANAQVKKNSEKFQERVEKKMEKFSRKSGHTNDEGYIVIPKTEYYVPGFGVVKVEAYDPWGGVASSFVLGEIK